jgi:hypothetical protein
MRFGVESGLCVLGNGITPASDRMRRGMDVLSYRRDAPPGLKQRNRDPASDFELAVVPLGLIETYSAESSRNFSQFKDQ